MFFKKIGVLALFFITLSNAIVHLMNSLMAGETVLLQWLPDDTFYYLNIAKHFSTQGIWTFDGGQTITTGFHPLWAYLLVPIVYGVGDDPILLMRTVASFSFMLALVSILVITTQFLKRETLLPLLVLSVFLSTISFLANSISGMEWSLAFTISVFYFYCLAYYPIKNIKLTLFNLFLLGIMGSLARSEFGVLTFACFSSAILLLLLTREAKYLLPSGVGLSGATVGLLLVFLHNAYFSGEWLQSSSQIKFFWSEAFGHSPVPVLLQISRIIFYVPVLRLDVSEALKLVNYANNLLVVAGIILGFSSLVFVRNRLSIIKILLKTQYQAAFLFISALLSIGYYLFIYTFNSFASQIWYTVFLTVPIFILVTFSLTLLIQHLKYPIIVTITLIILIIGNLITFYHSPPIYQGQELGKSIGLIVKQIKDERIGISDAGIVNFYQGGTVINTDGLINNEIKTYLYSGRLECYLLDKRIKYTTGFGSSELASVKMGAPIDWTAFSERQLFSYDLFQIALYRIDFSQLAKLAKCQAQTM